MITSTRPLRILGRRPTIVVGGPRNLERDGLEVIIAPGGEGLMGSSRGAAQPAAPRHQMPKVDGLQLLARMKADDRFRTCPS